jgi:hypothetical protein
MLNASYKMAASTSDKRMPITTPSYNVPSVDVTPDPPAFSLDTTFKRDFSPLDYLHFASSKKLNE